MSKRFSRVIYIDKFSWIIYSFVLKVLEPFDYIANINDRTSTAVKYGGGVNVDNRDEILQVSG